MGKNSKLKGVLVLFIILSIVKFFTMKIGLLGESTVKLVIKPNITLTNSFMIKGESNIVNRMKYESDWYYEGKPKVRTLGKVGSRGEIIYKSLIVTWWIFAIGLLIYSTNFIRVRFKE